ncbi:hypothetical protein CcCBS67573_g09643 [Chytriomyces confervae]|uniref:SHSP domain-containing protein n=1 Tax=Chytriomyces confervae TaxID=246404 RepID=A0A507DRI3_9FUNG|nr:hypothetical protein CcCBS67573_g09643 [Chytriomyces confervae]
MGLFSFMVKVGITAYAIDWVHKTYHGGQSNFFNHYKHMSIEDTASSVINSAEEATPKVRRWLHDACQRRKENRRNRFESINNTPDVTSTNLENGRVSLEIDVPGFNKEDVLLSVNEHESVVILKGKLDGDGTRGKRERSVDARIALPKNADLSDLKAKLENGVLRVDVGKREFEGKRVQIE